MYNICLILRVEVGSTGDPIERKMNDVAVLIQDGAATFLGQEYYYTFLFVVFFAGVIYFTAEPQTGMPYTTVAFFLGALTSILSGYIGMTVAVRANVRTAKESISSLESAFIVAFRGGLVLGFTLVGLGLLVLCGLMMWFKQQYGSELDSDNDDR